MKIYSEPQTKAMSLNVNAAICTEQVVTDSTTGKPGKDEQVGAPMF